MRVLPILPLIAIFGLPVIAATTETPMLSGTSLAHDVIHLPQRKNLTVVVKNDSFGVGYKPSSQYHW
jgi:hypothetical protein